ncbi:MAG TPA: PAS domain S-box protein [Pseudomonadales bacterium]|nr:PAS domain S-box protein [Pseudomonadales bacterium]
MDAWAAHRRLDPPVAIGLTIATLVIGVVVSALTSGYEVAASVFLFAMLIAGRTNHRGLVIAAAVAATATHILPTLLDAQLWRGSWSELQVGVGQMLWSSLYWMAAALLIWDPRHRHVAIEQIHEAFAHAPAATALVDTSGTIVHANDAFVQLAGRSDEPLIGASLDRLLGDALWDEIRAQRGELLSQADAHIRLEREFVRADGRKLWASIYARMLRDPSGKASYAVVQALDLTEQRRAQRALAVSESRFRGIIENTGEVTLVIDLEGRISYANPKAYEIFGAAATSLIGAKPLPFIHTTDRNEFGRALARTYRRPRETFRLTDVRLQNSDTFLDVQFTGLGDAPGIVGTVVTARITTDQVKAEKQLRVSENKFSTIFHSSPDAILIMRSEDSTIIDFNTGFTRLLGYTREEGIGLQDRELKIWANPHDRERVQAELEAHYECLDYETELVAKNGETLQTEISVRYVEIDGELCVLCIGRDITKRRLAETALKESEEKFARIFTGSPDGIVIIGLADGRILDINDAFVVASGFTYEELVGHRVSELPIFDDIEQLKRSTELVVKEGSLQNFDLMFRTKRGEQIPALVSATVVELEGTKSLVCIAKDNRAQRETEAKLRVSEERFRGAFENAPIGMLLTDTDGYIFQANHFAMQALAYSESEMVGSHISRLVPPQERQSLKDTFDRLQHRSGNVFRSERRMLCKDSIEIWTNFHVVLQRSEDGAPLYFIVQIADITEMKRSAEQMERMAFYDTLTDLANRRLFGDRLEQAIAHAQRTGTYAALLYLDLDQFKRVNDTLGHEAGDELLREVARRLTHCVRSEDTVARPGGDEFTILLYDIASPGDAGAVAEKILGRLRAPITISGHHLVVTTSIGITIIPSDSVQPNILTKNADLAMYRAKERGRNNYQYFAEEMNTKAQSRLRTENELREALEANRFELFYQPKVRLADQRITGVEALIRWHHPERGLLTPDKFISVAEETGVIVGIGAWVIQQACIAARDLTEQTGAPIQVAVNISTRQFRDPNLVNTVRRCIREAGIDPAQLEVEITETMLMDDAEAAAFTVERLHELGIKLAIDDFGTGYSSLNYLKRFPIDTVKIDRSFVMEIPKNPDDMAITAAVISMAHRLSLVVVAEGVETTEQLKFLSEHDCEYGQGYYFSKPLPFNEIQRFFDPSVALLRQPRKRPGGQSQ